MKNLFIFAMLLLGVVACSDQKEEVSMPETPGTSYLTGAPASQPRLYCMKCGGLTTFFPSYCELSWVKIIPFSLIWDCVPDYFISERTYLKAPIKTINAGSALKLDTAYAADYCWNYMFLFNKGDEYMRHMQLIGAAMEYNGGIPLLDIPDHYNFAMATYAVADSMRYGQDNCIPVTASYKTDALAMIAYWRPKWSNTDFQASLDSITADLNTCTGLTRAQLYAKY